ncbi:DUF3307 domain-containing protein [Listeria booriae]|uniref:DUF3307 domain-containing protein n=1 Tax=Listeria booriae TaxID=1552123 RepID=UPI001E3A0743|nr:DUF3307 domain-containing protein [Listeria booriae]MCD2207968.1 DUF3307 domain-containing protein [Listeria booriae]
MTNLLFPLLLGHFLGDFVLQTDTMADVKKEAFSSRKLRILSLHVFIHFCLYFLAVLGYWFVGGNTDIWLLMGMIVGISLLHLVIDLAKAPVERVLGNSSLVRLCTYCWRSIAARSHYFSRRSRACSDITGWSEPIC